MQSRDHCRALSLGPTCESKSPSSGAGIGKTVEAGQVPLRLMWKVLAKKAAKVVLVFKIHL